MLVRREQDESITAGDNSPAYAKFAGRCRRPRDNNGESKSPTTVKESLSILQRDDDEILETRHRMRLRGRNLPFSTSGDNERVIKG